MWRRIAIRDGRLAPKKRLANSSDNREGGFFNRIVGKKINHRHQKGPREPHNNRSMNTSNSYEKDGIRI
jgi:hypothetical protein